MAATTIEWATHTSNWLAGCTKVSPACAHCYAETMTRRLASGLGKGQPRYRAGVVDLETGRWTGKLAWDRDALMRAFDGLINAKKPRRVFCNSMSDTFHDDAPPESLTLLAERIDEIEHGRLDMTCVDWPHVIMLLTKRPENMLRWQREYFPEGLPPWVWVGCTVEDQQRADERVPVLLQVKARVRFLSVEPMLGAVDLTHVRWSDGRLEWRFDVLRGRYGVPGLWQADAAGSVQWVITGGEAGPKARPSHPDWFRALRDQCVVAGVPYFHKQNGEWAPVPAGVQPGFADWCVHPDGRPLNHRPTNAPGVVRMCRVGKKFSGRELDGRTWDEVPDAR